MNILDFVESENFLLSVSRRKSNESAVRAMPLPLAVGRGRRCPSISYFGLEPLQTLPRRRI